jgi:hypothetical protein
MLYSSIETRSSDKTSRLTGTSRNAATDLSDDGDVAYALVKVFCGDGEDVEELDKCTNECTMQGWADTILKVYIEAGKKVAELR